MAGRPIGESLPNSLTFSGGWPPNGLSGVQIGALSALNVLVSSPAAILWSGIADRLKVHRRVLLISVLAAPICVWLLGRTTSFGLFIPITLAYGLAIAPIIPLLDGAALLDQLKTIEPRPSIFFGGLGEPLLHPHTLDWIAQAKALQPDVILMDLLMPQLDGIGATRQITAAQPDMHILVLTSFAADDKVFPAIKAGALGYLLKDSEPEVLVEAIRQVYRGEPSLEPSIARKVKT